MEKTRRICVTVSDRAWNRAKIMRLNVSGVCNLALENAVNLGRMRARREEMTQDVRELDDLIAAEERRKKTAQKLKEMEASGAVIKEQVEGFWKENGYELAGLPEEEQREKGQMLITQYWDSPRVEAVKAKTGIPVSQEEMIEITFAARWGRVKL